MSRKRRECCHVRIGMGRPVGAGSLRWEGVLYRGVKCDVHDGWTAVNICWYSVQVVTVHGGTKAVHGPAQVHGARCLMNC